MAKRHESSFNFIRKSVERPTGAFTNSIGMTFQIVGLSPLEMPRIQASVTYPKKPTYRVETAGGGFEEHEHEVKIIPATDSEPEKVVSTLNTDEDKAAWAAYEEAFAKAESELSERMLRTCLLDGVVLTDVAKENMNRWKRRQELKGIPVSDDPDQLELDFKTSMVGQTPEDFQLLMELILSLTGVGEEDIEKLRRSFPDTV